MPGSPCVPGGADLMGAFDALDAIRERREPKPWVRPEFDPSFIGPVLAFDQSLSRTGWALMDCLHPYVHDRGLLTTSPGDETSIEGSLVRATALEEEIDHLVWRLDAPGLMIAHEAPAVAGWRTDSSLLVALAIRIIARRRKLPLHMVYAQHAKRRMTGNANADKPEVKVALEEMWPHLKGTRPWNNDIRDAVLIGILALEEGAAP